jgi:hypothetical protein
MADNPDERNPASEKRSQRVLTDLEIRLVDRKYLKPVEIAEIVWQDVAPELEKFTNWETLVFATELLGRLSLGLQNPILIELSVLMSRHIHSMHYNHPNQLYKTPNRPQSLPHVMDEPTEEP